MDPSACQKKMHSLLSMSMSQEKSSRQHSEDHDVNLRERHVRRDDEEYGGRVTRKKLKAISHQIDNFNTFGGTNMINELLKKKVKKEEPNESSSFMNTNSQKDTRVINFSDDEMSGEKVKKHSGRKSHGSLRPFGNMCSDAMVKGEH